MLKDIKGFDGKIKVNEIGEVFSFLQRPEGKILKAQADQKGYLRIKITVNRNSRTIKVHRVVAEAFIPNPQNLPQVNHKDGNKLNNRADNLEWVSASENAKHACKNGLWKNQYDRLSERNVKKPILAFNGDQIIRFESISACERYFSSRHICAVLKGERQHVKGWTFVYESEVMA